ncbi:hypothetical protein CLFO_03650 [Clostridium formicaceticum]|nr:hypothetical protein CLFO_03650 [Clostridium formicaceticum]
MMVFCTKCGKELTDFSLFCSVCGMPVEEPKIKQEISSATLLFKYQKNPMLMMLTEPLDVTLDGQLHFNVVSDGEVCYNVAQGNHTFSTYVPYMSGKKYGLTTKTFYVGANEVLEICYKPPMAVFMAANITIRPVHKKPILETAEKEYHHRDLAEPMSLSQENHQKQAQNISLNDEGIKSILHQYKQEGEEFVYYLYGVVEATFKEAIKYGPFVSFANTYYLVLFSNKKIDMIELSKLTMKPKPVNHYLIPIEDVKLVKVSSWLSSFGKQFNILTKEGKGFKLKVSKVCYGIKEQKNNMKKFERYIESLGLKA